MTGKQRAFTFQDSKDVQAKASGSAQYHRCNVMTVIPDESAGALVAPGNQKCLGRKRRGGLGMDSSLFLRRMLLC